LKLFIGRHNYDVECLDVLVSVGKPTLAKPLAPLVTPPGYFVYRPLVVLHFIVCYIK